MVAVTMPWYVCAHEKDFEAACCDFFLCIVNAFSHARVCVRVCVCALIQLNDVSLWIYVGSC